MSEWAQTIRTLTAPRSFVFKVRELLRRRGCPQQNAHYCTGNDLSVTLLTRAELSQLETDWQQAFPGQYKNYRYYDLVEETLHPEFNYRYLVLLRRDNQVLAVQPYFVLDQDMLAGTKGRLKALIDGVRKYWPKFLYVRTVMVGCVAGEGHLDVRGDNLAHPAHMALLAKGVLKAARQDKAQLVVFKEFKDHYRPVLNQLRACGFVRVPSLPMTKLNIDYKNFDEYFNAVLGRSTRKDLRRKFRHTDTLPIKLSVHDDVSAMIDELYPLYLQVYKRSPLQFEKLTKDYLSELGRRMPERTRFFVWRLNGKAIAFNLCMISDTAIYDKYIGLDYEVALDLHLYHYTFREIVTWAMANGYKWYCSTSLNYDPKYHWRMQLDPLDLYVRHRFGAANAMMKWVLPLLDPTKYDKTLQRFANFADLKKDV